MASNGDPYYYGNNLSVTTGSTTAGWLTTSSAYSTPLTFTAAPHALAPAPRPPLAWLDDEIEKTCALAR